MTDVIAHRGLHLTIRENTVEAFRAAVAAGAAGIELDARRTADGAIVVHHDAHLPDGRAIVGCLRPDLPDWLPELAVALDACEGAFVNVEIKNDPAEPDFDPGETVADAVMAVLGGRDEPSDRWLISSFRLETIDRCRQLDPAIPTAWLTADALDEATVADVVARGHGAVHPWEPTVDLAMIERCHAHGLRVNAWTCNDPARAAELAAWGIDGICTDEVPAVAAALATDDGATGAQS